VAHAGRKFQFWAKCGTSRRQGSHTSPVTEIAHFPIATQYAINYDLIAYYILQLYAVCNEKCEVYADKKPRNMQTYTKLNLGFWLVVNQICS